MVLSVAPAFAQTPAAAPSPRQAAYDAGQAAFDKGDWPTAIADFRKVVAGVETDTRSTAIIRVRLATALAAVGRFDEARAQATRGVAALRAQATGPDVETAAAYSTLGDILRFDFDEDAAIDAYTQAKAFAAGDDKSDAVATANLGIALAAMTVHPDLAATTVDAMIAAPDFAGRAADWRAQIFALRARAELNRGDAKKAQAFIQEALRLGGHMTSSTLTLSEVEIRGDAALIFARLNDKEETRKYLAYSGAGEMPEAGRALWKAADIDTPVCGPDVGLDDTAVVEFAIDSDGHTAGAAPVYASRPGTVGVAFARAVRGWSWKASAVQSLPTFWRQAIRVQMRCAETPRAQALSEPFAATTLSWLHAHGVDAQTLSDEGPPPDAAPGTPPDVAAIVPLLRKLDSDTTAVVFAADADRLSGLLTATQAPVETRAFAAWRVASRAPSGNFARQSANRLAKALPAFDALPGAARSAAWLRLEMALSLEGAGDFAAAAAPLKAVVALPESALPHDDPIRTVAVLHLSLVDSQTGRAADAKAVLEQAGVTAQGCDLLDTRPVMRSTPVSDSAFPEEAQAWGFEGTVRTGVDIAPNGSVKQARALIVYPPFVFGDSAVSVVSRFEYLPPRVGGEVVGCAGAAVTINFRLP